MKLTREEILSLSGSTLSEAVAQHVMGWPAAKLEVEKEWRPHDDIRAAMKVQRRFHTEEAIRRFIAALLDVTAVQANMVKDDPDCWTMHIRAIWVLVHATPEQRCRAALLAMLMMPECICGGADP